MVCPSASEVAGKLTESAGMRCKSSKRIHNFKISSYKWGKHKHFRCINENANGESRSSRSDESAESRNVADAMEAVREKIMLDLKTVADKLKEKILRKQESEGSAPAESPAESPPEAAALPWNLRSRIVKCDGPYGGGKAREKKSDGEWRQKAKPEKKAAAALKLIVPLSKKEIEEDFIKMLGRKPLRKPKKRTRIVQRELDTLFPGLRLTKISADSYDVPE